MDTRRRRYVLLDRDGVINRRNPEGYGACWEKFEFLPRALDGMRLLAANDYAGIVISRHRQTGDGDGSTRDLERVTRRFLTEVALSEGNIAKVYYCPHRKDERCQCYRSNDGLIARASREHGFQPEETYFVSESEFDLEAAAAVGCRCIRIQRDAFLRGYSPSEEPHRVASNLYEAAEWIVAARRVRGLAFAGLGR